MGLFQVDCQVCRKPFMWQSSNYQICSACTGTGHPVPNHGNASTGVPGPNDRLNAQAQGTTPYGGNGDFPNFPNAHYPGSQSPGAAGYYICTICGNRGHSPCQCATKMIINASPNRGWECPRCSSCYAPSVAECYRCNASKVTISVSSPPVMGGGAMSHPMPGGYVGDPPWAMGSGGTNQPAKPPDTLTHQYAESIDNGTVGSIPTIRLKTVP